nr:hypothetical protein [Tanacetum cinerariifolium]
AGGGIGGDAVEVVVLWDDCGGDGDEDGSVVEVMMAEWRWRRWLVVRGDGDMGVVMAATVVVMVMKMGQWLR